MRRFDTGTPARFILVLFLLLLLLLLLLRLLQIFEVGSLFYVSLGILEGNVEIKNVRQK